MLQFGDLILCRYLNYKMDPSPMTFILKSDARYTEGLNSHYLSKEETFFLRLLIGAAPDNINNTIYYYLKGHGSAINRAYRKYFTNLLVVIKTWQVTGITDVDYAIGKSVDELQKKYNVVLPDVEKKIIELMKTEKQLAKNSQQREKYWLDKAKTTSNKIEQEAYQKIAYERGKAHQLTSNRIREILRNKK